MFRDESVDTNFSRLPDPVSAGVSWLVKNEEVYMGDLPILALPVHGRVIVAVVKDDRICASQASGTL